MFAYVLINAQPAHEHEVYNKLLKTEEILEIFPLFGEYDLITKIQAESREEIGAIVTEKIRPVKGILATKTLIGY